MRVIITMEVDEKEVKIISTEFERKTEVLFDDADKESETGISMYAAWFDEGCVGWTKDAGYNKMFVMTQLSYANDMLRAKGHLFLNDVYDLFGIPHTKYGQVVGWVYDPFDPTCDNFVDFGLREVRNADFMNGRTNKVLLDFNVDGNILDRI